MDYAINAKFVFLPRYSIQAAFIIIVRFMFHDITWILTFDEYLLLFLLQFVAVVMMAFNIIRKFLFHDITWIKTL